jgi:hypothetical protein
MIARWTMLIVVAVAFTLPLAACGKKPTVVKAPDENVKFPTQYPSSR